MRLSLQLAPLLLAGTASMGCAVDTPDEAIESSQQSAALVHVAREDGSSHVVARYVRATTVTGDALRATGGTFELPALGQCSALDAQLGAAPLLPVELVAAGSTTLSQRGRILDLVPRSVPDVSDLVSGYVYSKTADLQPGRASLTLAGLADPIEVDVPPSLADVELDGMSGVLELDGGSRSVQLSWTQARAEGAEHLVVADVHGGATPMRCTLEDSGRAELERSFFGARGTVVLRRLVHVELERDPFQRVVVDSETSRTLTYAKAAR